MPAAIACLAAGVGIGWLARAVLGSWVAGTSAAAVALGIVVGIAFAVPAAPRVPTDIEALTYQARLNDHVGGLVARAGGPERLKACGDVYTGPFQVPVVAWYMHLHTTLVSSLLPHRPAVLCRVRSNPASRPGPTMRPLGTLSDTQTLSVAPGWRVVAACRGTA